MGVQWEITFVVRSVKKGWAFFVHHSVTGRNSHGRFFKRSLF